MEQNNKYYILALTEEQKPIVLAALKCLSKNYEDKMSAYRFSTNTLHRLRQEYKTTKEIKAVLETQELVECTKENPFAWHSVKDSLPTITDGYSANVLAVDEYGNQGVAWLRQYSNGTTDWWSCDDRLMKYAIIAWQEIEPYKAKEGK